MRCSSPPLLLLLPHTLALGVLLYLPWRRREAPLNLLYAGSLGSCMERRAAPLSLLSLFYIAPFTTMPCLFLHYMSPHCLSLLLYLTITTHGVQCLIPSVPQPSLSHRSSYHAFCSLLYPLPVHGLSSLLPSARIT